jgi:hypothetical protein
VTVYRNNNVTASHDKGPRRPGTYRVGGSIFHAEIGAGVVLAAGSAS